MSTYLRLPAAGGLYFFTLASYQRQPLLTSAAMRHSLRHAIQQVRLRYPFDIHGWVLLPDHLHCIWQLPDTDADFSRRWSMIKRLTTQQMPSAGQPSLSRLLRGEGCLWQRRFREHRIRDEADYQQHMDYLHWNPVKHGLVSRLADWPWSSFHRLVREGVYPQDWGWQGELNVPE